MLPRVIILEHNDVTSVTTHSEFNINPLKKAFLLTVLLKPSLVFRQADQHLSISADLNSLINVEGYPFPTWYQRRLLLLTGSLY